MNSLIKTTIWDRKISVVTPLVLMVLSIFCFAANADASDVHPYLKGAIHTGRHTGRGADAYNLAPSGRLSAGASFGRFFLMETTLQHGKIELETVGSNYSSGTFTVFFVSPQLDVLGAFNRIELALGPTAGVGRMRLDARNRGVSTEAINTGIYLGGYAAILYNSKNQHWSVGMDVMYSAYFSRESCTSSNGTTMCTGPQKREREGFISVGGCVRVSFH